MRWAAARLGSSEPFRVLDRLRQPGIGVRGSTPPRDSAVEHARWDRTAGHRDGAHHCAASRNRRSAGVARVSGRCGGWHGCLERRTNQAQTRRSARLLTARKARSGRESAINEITSRRGFSLATRDRHCAAECEGDQCGWRGALARSPVIEPFWRTVNSVGHKRVRARPAPERDCGLRVSLPEKRKAEIQKESQCLVGGAEAHRMRRRIVKIFLRSYAGFGAAACL